MAKLAASGIEIDAVECLLPIPLHADGVVELLDQGWHVNAAEADVQRPAGRASECWTRRRPNDRVLRVMENYLFYEPLRRLKAVVEAGDIGEVAGYHVKMVGSGNGGWDVPWSSFEWQLQADAARPRHHGVRRRLAQARPPRCGCSARSARSAPGSGPRRSGPGIDIDAPAMLGWEHENGVRGVWDITLAPDLYMRSDYYTNDERWEVTGTKGYARVNRITGRGIQQPSLEVYRDGEMRGYHALDDDWGSSFRDSGRHWLRWLRTGEGPLLWSGSRGR